MTINKKLLLLSLAASVAASGAFAKGKGSKTPQTEASESNVQSTPTKTAPIADANPMERKEPSSPVQANPSVDQLKEMFPEKEEEKSKEKEEVGSNRQNSAEEVEKEEEVRSNRGNSNEEVKEKEELQGEQHKVEPIEELLEEQSEEEAFQHAVAGLKSQPQEEQRQIFQELLMKSITNFLREAKMLYTANPELFGHVFQGISGDLAKKGIVVALDKPFQPSTTEHKVQDVPALTKKQQQLAAIKDKQSEGKATKETSKETPVEPPKESKAKETSKETPVEPPKESKTAPALTKKQQQLAAIKAKQSEGKAKETSKETPVEPPKESKAKETSKETTVEPLKESKTAPALTKKQQQLAEIKAKQAKK